jgi:hypothetical protein
MLIVFLALLLAYLTVAALHGAQTAEMLLLFHDDGMFPLFNPVTEAQPRILQEIVTDGGGWRVELADYGEPAHFELWSTRLSPPGQRIKISQQTHGQGWDVATGFVVVRNGAHWRAVYVLSQIAYGVHDLYAVNVDGGQRALVDTLALPPLVRFGTDKVTFASEIQAGGTVQWWVSDTLQVTSTKPVLFADGFESGNAGRWR